MPREKKEQIAIAHMQHLWDDELMNKTAAEFTYEAFLVWHKEATERLLEGESISEPSVKFFDHWKRNREAAKAAAAVRFDN